MVNKNDVRCDANQYNSLLFRYNEDGIWVYCRDCRRDDGKRGVEHFYSWAAMAKLALGLDNDRHKRGPDRNNQQTESVRTTD